MFSIERPGPATDPKLSRELPSEFLRQKVSEGIWYLQKCAAPQVAAHSNHTSLLPQVIKSETSESFLSRRCYRLRKRGAAILFSNHVTPKFHQLQSKASWIMPWLKKRLTCEVFQGDHGQHHLWCKNENPSSSKTPYPEEICTKG